MSQMQPNRPAYQQLVGKQQVCKSVQGNRRCAQATLVDACPGPVRRGLCLTSGVASGSDVRSAAPRVRVRCVCVASKERADGHRSHSGLVVAPHVRRTLKRRSYAPCPNSLVACSRRFACVCLCVRCVNSVGVRVCAQRRRGARRVSQPPAAGRGRNNGAFRETGPRARAARKAGPQDDVCKSEPL